MRIVINGWFSEQLTTGSGQYLTALLEWLPRAGGPRVGGEHEFVVVWTRTIEQMANQRISESANRQRSANRR